MIKRHHSSTNKPYIDFNTSVTPIHKEGRLHWDDDSGTLEIGLKGGTAKLQVGQEIVIRAKASEAISDGELVYIDGADGVNPTMSLASASETTGSKTLGMATEDISSGQQGYVTTFGLVRDIAVPTATFSDGDEVFLNTTSGGFTADKLSHPNFRIKVGYVLKAHDTEGTIFINIRGEQWLKRLQAMQEPTGFDRLIPAQMGDISFVPATRTFTIEPQGGESDFRFWSNAKEFRRTSADTVVIDDTEGLWFIYYDIDGLLTASLTPWDFTTGKAYVAILYWDATNKTNLGLGEERHGIQMDAATHEYLHETFGAVWESGFTPSITADENGSLDAHAEIQAVAAGVFDDEDIEHSSVEQTGSFIMLYKEGSGAYFRKEVVGNALVAITGTRPDYNKNTAGTWSREEVASTKFTLTHLFVTNSTAASKNILVMGENEYNSKSDAQDGAQTELTSLITGALPTPEFVAVATFIIECKDSFTNSYNARVVSTADGGDFIDFRTSEKTGVGAVATHHGNLTGLLEDDHTQYVLADGSREMAALEVVTGYNGLTVLSDGKVGLGTAVPHDSNVAAGGLHITGSIGATQANDIFIDKSGEITRFHSIGSTNSISGRFELKQYAADADPAYTILTTDADGTTHLQQVGADGIVVATGSDGALSTITDDSTNWDTAYSHVSNDGTDHSYIDQDVTTTGTPTFGITTLADASTLASSAAPTADAEIANKKYVDDNGGGSYLGGTNLTLVGDTFNVDDAFLINDGNDVTTGGIEMDYAHISATAAHTITDSSDDLVFTNPNAGKKFKFNIKPIGTAFDFVTIGGANPQLAINTGGNTVSMINTSIFDIQGTYTFSTAAAMNFQTTISSGNFNAIYFRPVLNTDGVVNGIVFEPTFGSNDRAFSLIRFNPLAHTVDYDDVYTRYAETLTRSFLGLAANDTSVITYNAFAIGGAVTYFDLGFTMPTYTEEMIKLSGGINRAGGTGGTIIQKGLQFAGFGTQSALEAGDSCIAMIADGGKFEHKYDANGTNNGLFFGGGLDSYIGYNGTDFAIDTALVGSGTLDLVSQSASAITTEVLSEYVTIKIGGVSKKIAIVA